MPKTMYFYPFTDQKIDSGFVGDISAKTALHCISPTFGFAKYKYLWKMGANSGTFNGYVANADRIYVMGHCSPGDDSLSTGIVTGTHKCSTDELAAHFLNHGLPKPSHVNVRIHACDSGSPSPAVGTQMSFAERLKQEMVALGYHNVTVRGYKSGMGYYFIFREGATIFTKASAHANVVDF